MNCQQVHESLDDYLGGYLDEAERRAMEHHTMNCDSCHARLKELQDLLQLTQELEAEVSPARDLWPGILGEIEGAQSRSWASTNRPWMALAAVLALAVLLIPLSLRQLAREPGEEMTATSTGTTQMDTATLAKADLARSEDRVLLMRRDLVEAIEIRRDLLGPEAYASVEESLLVLDRAVGEIQQALEENPNNRRLRLLLAAKYQHEVRLLQRVSRV